MMHWMPCSTERSVRRTFSARNRKLSPRYRWLVGRYTERCFQDPPLDLDLELMRDKTEAQGPRARMRHQDDAPKGLCPARREGLHDLLHGVVDSLDDGDFEEKVVHQPQNPAPDDVRAENPGEENYRRGDQDSQPGNVAADQALSEGRCPGIEQAEQPGDDEDAGADGDEDEQARQKIVPDPT